MNRRSSFVAMLAIGVVAAVQGIARGDDTPVRVSILRHQSQTVISSDDGLVVRRPDSKPALPYVAPSITTVLDIKPSQDGLLLAGAIPAGRAVALSPLGTSTIAVDGQPYRGSVIVQSDGDGTLDIINVVGLDQYLYSVVGSEMDPDWPAAALQAQAIVARTYAVAHLGTREWLGYDLFAGERDQAYGGIDGEAPGPIAAVNATAGTILLYGGEPVHTYYSSCDGGYTSSGDALTDPQPYLRPEPDAYCTLSPDDRWTAAVDLDRLRSALAPSAGDVGVIEAVEPGPRDVSGRLESVTIRGTVQSVTIRATEFRTLAGVHTVKSTRISSMDISGSTLTVSGSGFGHGVGMSQWGAKVMAGDGKSARAILTFYYRGVQFAQTADQLRKL